MRVLALLTARGGSVTLPRKNVLPFAGKPLIAHSILAAQAARAAGAPIPRIAVSTDDEEIAAVCRDWGAEVPFMRPPELARADTASLPVAQHALRVLEAEDGAPYDWLLLLQPTSPLRTTGDILAALHVAEAGRASAVIGVTDANGYHPAKLKVIRDGVLAPYLGGDIQQPRRQDFGTDVCKTNGAIYLTRRDVVMEENSFFGTTPLPYLMPPERSIDIDTALDFEIAEFLFLRDGRDRS